MCCVNFWLSHLVLSFSHLVRSDSYIALVFLCIYKIIVGLYMMKLECVKTMIELLLTSTISIDAGLCGGVISGYTCRSSVTQECKTFKIRC